MSADTMKNAGRTSTAAAGAASPSLSRASVRKEHGPAHDVLVLTAITLCSGLLLGLAHEATQGAIAAQAEQKRIASGKALFPDAEDFRSVKDWDADSFAQILADDGLDNTVVSAVDEAVGPDGSVLGYLVDVTNSEGYGGDIELLAGIETGSDTLTIGGISFLAINETAGLGMKATESSFLSQFEGLKANQDGQITSGKSGASGDGVIDAISGASHTTGAVTKAVNGALKAASYEQEAQS